MVNNAPVAKDRPKIRPSREHGTLALEGVLVLGRLSALFAERRRQLGESVGLTDQQWQALEEVQTEHFMPSLFAKERASSAAAVSKILRQLTDKGLVTAHVSDVDARQRSYQVTARGRAVLDELREGRREAIREVWLSLEAERLENFVETGTLLADRLEEFTEKKRRESARSRRAQEN